METATHASSPSSIRPLDAAERRVLGTLVEKAKTTPDQYPLSLNALVNGCNQKSNRDPEMSLDEEQVTKAITSLRALGAVAEVFADRAYQPDGSLASRAIPGAVIADEAAAVAQVARLVREGKVRAITGADISLRGETVCLHGDGIRAVAFARRLREALAEMGVEVKAFSS